MLGADRFCEFDPGHSVEDLRALLAELRAQVGDLSPVMQKLAAYAAGQARYRFGSGGGEKPWPPRALTTIARDKYRGASGPLGGSLVTTILPFWSAVNAGWASRAPHAHLFDGGVKQYHDASGARTYRYQNKGKRTSRAKSREFLSHGNAAGVHQPPRPFAYLPDSFYAFAENTIVDALEATVNGS